MDTTVNAVYSNQMEPPRCPCGATATCAFSYENRMSQYACDGHDPTLQPAWAHFRPPNFTYTTKVLPQATWAVAGGSGSVYGGSWVSAAGGGGGGGAGGTSGGTGSSGGGGGGGSSFGAIGTGQ